MTDNNGRSLRAGVNPFNQTLNTTSDVVFNSVETKEGIIVDNSRAKTFTVLESDGKTDSYKMYASDPDTWVLEAAADPADKPSLKLDGEGGVHTFDVNARDTTWLGESVLMQYRPDDSGSITHRLRRQNGTKRSRTTYESADTTELFTAGLDDDEEDLRFNFKDSGGTEHEIFRLYSGVGFGGFINGPLNSVGSQGGDLMYGNGTGRPARLPRGVYQTSLMSHGADSPYVSWKYNGKLYANTTKFDIPMDGTPYSVFTDENNAFLTVDTSATARVTQGTVLRVTVSLRFTSDTTGNTTVLLKWGGVTLMTCTIGPIVVATNPEVLLTFHTQINGAGYDANTTLLQQVKGLAIDIKNTGDISWISGPTDKIECTASGADGGVRVWMALVELYT